jgi:hypothetical protein
LVELPTTINREHFVLFEVRMTEPMAMRERHRVRYTFALSPSELELSTELASCEFRTLADFFRAHIYETAKGRELDFAELIQCQADIGNDGSSRNGSANEQVQKTEDVSEVSPDGSKPEWGWARVTLEGYFNMNQRQMTSIFGLTIIFMAAGFFILTWGIVRANDTPNALVPSAIAGVAGVLTEFIGASFLVIYRLTIEQARSNIKTLERIISKRSVSMGKHT